MQMAMVKVLLLKHLCLVLSVSVCVCDCLTCRFGPGEDEGSSAAATDLLVTGVDVDAVDSEGL